MARVLNKRTDEILPDAIYVGRPSKWGNPYRMSKYRSRKLVIEWYRRHIEQEIRNGCVDLSELRGKDLVCWCSPLPCHGDILLELANKPEEV